MCVCHCVPIYTLVSRFDCQSGRSLDHSDAWPWLAGLLRNSFKTSFRIPSPGMKLPGKERELLAAGCHFGMVRDGEDLGSELHATHLPPPRPPPASDSALNRERPLSGHCRTSTASTTALETQCQIECQIECQIDCQRECQECQNICQIECQLVGVARRKY